MPPVSLEYQTSWLQSNKLPSNFQIYVMKQLSLFCKLRTPFFLLPGWPASSKLSLSSHSHPGELLLEAGSYETWLSTLHGIPDFSRRLSVSSGASLLTLLYSQCPAENLTQSKGQEMFTEGRKGRREEESNLQRRWRAEAAGRQDGLLVFMKEKGWTLHCFLS